MGLATVNSDDATQLPRPGKVPTIEPTPLDKSTIDDLPDDDLFGDDEPLPDDPPAPRTLPPTFALREASYPAFAGVPFKLSWETDEQGAKVQVSLSGQENCDAPIVTTNTIDANEALLIVPNPGSYMLCIVLESADGVKVLRPAPVRLDVRKLVTPDERIAAPLLSEAGLYADMATRKIGLEHRPYKPQHELWSDGADKRRWIFLPPGTTIDTTSVAGQFTFPVGTVLWKEFARAGKLLETRMIVKYQQGGGNAAWSFSTYKWDEDMAEARLVGPAGEANVLGTTHDIPSRNQCSTCHNSRTTDPILGFSPIQLNGTSLDLTAYTLTKLTDEGLLSAPIATPPNFPGSAIAQSALGYMHANCGHCHNGVSGVTSVPLVLRVAGTSANLADEPVYKLLINPARPYIALGSPALSLLYMRLTSTTSRMPPLGTEISDTAAIQKISDWIVSTRP